MKAVSNTSPLRYLIAIEQERLLGQLFEKVFVPVAVREELTDPKTQETVRRRVLALPAWFEVRTAQETQKTTLTCTEFRREGLLNTGTRWSQFRRAPIGRTRMANFEK
jgi:predicted nucleic acid-binding protein